MLLHIKYGEQEIGEFHLYFHPNGRANHLNDALDNIIAAGILRFHI